MLLNRTCLISFQWIKMIVSDVVKTLEKRKFLKRKPHSGPEGRRFLQRHFHQTRSEIHRESRVVAGYSRTYREITDEEHILIYGLCGGVLIVLLKLVEYQFLVVEHSIEIYGGLIAVPFAVLSIWLGLKLTKTKETVVVREVLLPAP